MQKGVDFKKAVFMVGIVLLGVISFIYGNSLSKDMSVLETISPFIDDIKFPTNDNLLVSQPDVRFGPSGRGLTTVVQVRDPNSADNGGFWTGSNGYYWQHYDKNVIKTMLNNGVMEMTGQATPAAAWQAVIPYSSGDTIAIKINQNVGGLLDNTYDANPAFVDALAEVLNQHLGIPLNNLYFYDPSHPRPSTMNRFRDAYMDNNFYFGKYHNVDTSSADYGGSGNPPNNNYINIITAYSDLAAADTANGFLFNDDGGFANYLPYVVTQADHVITVSLLKNHGASHGGTFTMKNQGIGTPQVNIDSSGRYGSYSRNDPDSQMIHDQLLCANVNAQIDDKSRLAIIDGIYGQVYPSSWHDPETTWNSFGDQPPGVILLGTDSVAVDSVANYVLEQEDIASGTNVYDTSGSWILGCVRNGETVEGIGVYESYSEVISNGGFVDIDYLIYGEGSSCVDNDGDGYGSPGDASCPGGSQEDCDDTDILEFPGQVWYKDADGDGYSDGTSVSQCNRFSGYFAASELVATSGDCDDNPAICGSGCSPGNVEICFDSNGYDEDCNGVANANDPNCITCQIVNTNWMGIQEGVITSIEEPNSVLLVLDSIGCGGEQVNFVVREYNNGVATGIQPVNVNVNINSNRVNSTWQTSWVSDTDSTPNVNEYKITATIVGEGITDESDYLNVNRDSTDPILIDHDGDYSLLDIDLGSSSASFNWGASEGVNYHLVVRVGAVDGTVIFDGSDLDTYQTLWQVVVPNLDPETTYYYSLDACDNRDNCLSEGGNFVSADAVSSVTLDASYLEDTILDLAHPDINRGARTSLGTNDDNPTLMRWDLSLYQGAQLESAKLRIYNIDTYNPGATANLYLYPMIINYWVEGVGVGDAISTINGATWNEYNYSGTNSRLWPGGIANSYNSGDLTVSQAVKNANTYMEFDVTPLIQSLLDGTYDWENGFYFYPDLYINFRSAEYISTPVRSPELVLEFIGEPPECQTNQDCDDGLYCNGAEICDGSLHCQAGTAVSCVGTDPYSCTTDTCDEATDSCIHTLGLSYCLIDSSCYLIGSSNPSWTCEVCNPFYDQHDWDPIACECTISGDCGFGDTYNECAVALGDIYEFTNQSTCGDGVCDEVPASQGNLVEDCTDECTDNDGANNPLFAGQVLDYELCGLDDVNCPSPIISNDYCFGGNLRQYACTGNDASSYQVYDCDNLDCQGGFSCSVNGANLVQSGTNYDCPDGSGACQVGSPTQCNSWSCSAQSECTQVSSCGASAYTCYYSNAGQYSWSSSPLSSETSCSDDHDNNCDGEYDYDGSGDGVEHGDAACTVGVVSANIRETNVPEGSNIIVDCQMTVGNVESVTLDINQGSCGADYTWSGNVATFTCNVGAGSGTRTVTCGVDTSISYQSGTDKVDTVSVYASSCSGLAQGECSSNPTCEWCANCQGSQTNNYGGSSLCVPDGTCTYSCVGDSCAAECGVGETQLDVSCADEQNMNLVTYGCNVNTCVFDQVIDTQIQSCPADTVIETIECVVDVWTNTTIGTDYFCDIGGTEVCSSININSLDTVDCSILGGYCDDNQNPVSCMFDTTETSCSDGLDNDQDGYLDNVDSDCLGTYTLHLEGGKWNFVSIPLDLNPGYDVDSLGVYTLLKFENGRWRMAQNGIFDMVGDLEVGKGYSIFSLTTRDIVLSGRGHENHTEIIVPDEWNLVGVVRNGLIDDFYPGAGSYTIWNYTGNNQYVDVTGQSLVPGVAYWVAPDGVEGPPQERSSGWEGVKSLVNILGLFMYDISDLPRGNLFYNNFEK